MQLLEIIIDALPEALGGIITAGILGALALLINKWRSGEKIKTDNILHNLPRPDYEKFVGRQDKLQYIVDKLIGRPYLISIDGVGGIGKSALAIEIGHRFLNMTITTQGKPLQKKYYYDVIVWASAKRFSLRDDGIITREQEIQTFEDILNTIAITLNKERFLGEALKDKKDLIRTELTKHRALLIIDNLETIDDDQLIEFLRELPEPTKAIITTRHQISGTDQVHLLGLSEENSYTLMETESSLRGITISEEKMEMLYQRTGGVPLAIVWTIAKMKYYKTDDVISLHTDDAQYISHYCFYEVVENIVERPSYHTLLALSLFSNKATREALGHVTGFPPPLRDATLEELQKLSLINKTSHHFWMLPLTREFVTEQLNLPENSELKEKLKHQFADYYNHLKIRKANETKEFIRSIHFALDLHSINIWQTDIHDYWQANKKALARGVKISRIFFMSKSIVYNDGQLNSLVIDVLNMQYDSGVSVKILWKEELDRQNIFHSTGQEIFHPLDLIIFDNTEAHIHKGSGGWYTDVVILDDSKSIEHWQKKYKLIEKYCIDWKDCPNTKNS